MKPPQDPLLFVITSSYDATTDLLLRFLPPDQVFRFNTDLFREYRLLFDDTGFTVIDPTGRTASSDEVYKAYWRWPEWPISRTEEERYVQQELRYLVQEMANLLWSQDKFVLVEPGAPRRTGKLLQLTRARAFLQVPQFQAELNLQCSSPDGLAVVKSLSSSFLGAKFIFSTVVDPSCLAPSYPWFMQRYVQASCDVTVVVVRNQLFAFKLVRDFLKTSIDWRQIPEKERAWSRIELPQPTCAAILNYMNDLRFHFGRLDFLMDENQQLYFCEVNPNGQYAWLDFDGKHGLLSAILQELSPATKRHSIPVAHPLSKGRRSHNQPGAQTFVLPL
jgi:hypothetical protein